MKIGDESNWDPLPDKQRNTPALTPPLISNERGHLILYKSSARETEDQ